MAEDVWIHSGRDGYIGQSKKREQAVCLRREMKTTTYNLLF